MTSSFHDLFGAEKLTGAVIMAIIKLFRNPLHFLFMNTTLAMPLALRFSAN